MYQREEKLEGKTLPYKISNKEVALWAGIVVGYFADL